MEKRIEIMNKAGFGKWMVERINYKNSDWFNTQWDIVADFPTLESARAFIKDSKIKGRIFNYPVGVVVE